MPIPFTAIKTEFLQSIEFRSLLPSACLLFLDLLVKAKAANPKARGHPKNETPFRFHSRHIRSRMCKRDFYRHLRMFEALGLIEIIRPRRPGLANFIVLSEEYRHIVR